MSLSNGALMKTSKNIQLQIKKLTYDKRSDYD